MLEKKYTDLLKQLLLLAPIPIIWVLLDQPWEHNSPVLQELKNTAMDWRYKMRGPVVAKDANTGEPVKLIYADVDAITVSHLGERPWNRRVYAEVAQALIELGEAKAVGYDFILSTLMTTDMVPQEKINESNLHMENIMTRHPDKIVLGASYSGVMQDSYMDKPAFLPLLYQGHTDPKTNPYPEVPSFPIIDLERGLVGLINPDLNRHIGAVPRWVPMFARTEGSQHTRNIAEGTRRQFSTAIELYTEELDETYQLVTEQGIAMAEWPKNTSHTFLAMALQLLLSKHGLDESAVEISEDYIYITKDDENLYEIPLVDGQIVEVNWFSKWITPPSDWPTPVADEDYEPMQEPYNPRMSVQKILELRELFIASLSPESWDEYLQLAQKPSQKGLEVGRVLEKFNISEDMDSFTVNKSVLYTFSDFKDSIVLVGPVDTTLQDVAPSPFDSAPVPKVGVHGNLVKTILSGEYIKRIDPVKEVLITLILSFVIAFTGFYSGRFSTFAKVLNLGGLVAYIIAVFYVFNVANLVLPLIAPAGSAITTAVVGLIWRVVQEEKQKGRIKGMFGTYLSPELVHKMVESGDEPQLGGIDETITAFFSDVQSFSVFSEKLTPKQLVDLMNEYLTAMTDILMEEGCYVDKYIGDAIVGIFNAPVELKDHALRGCIASQRMQIRQAELREKWASEGDKWPDVVPKMQTRMGLNTGHATVGNMGSERRFNYTMMGDTVNLAARSESGAKSYGVYTMITGETKEEAEKHGDDCVFRYLDKIIVKGRSQPAVMYEVVCLKDLITEETKKCLDVYNEAMENYLKQNFEKAIELFEKASELEPNRIELNPHAPTTPSLVMLERCHEYKDDPPGEGWDGVYVMKTK